MDPYKIRPRRDWAVILQDERKRYTSAGIYIPEETNHEKLHEGSGVIVEVGLGDVAKTEDLHSGVRVIYRTYLRHANRIETDEVWPTGEKKEFFLIAAADIVAVIGLNVEVGLLSEGKMA